MSTEPLLSKPEGLKPISSLSSFHGGKPTLADRLGKYATAVWLFGPLVLGLAVGAFTPTAGEPCSGLPAPVERLSTIIGWTYFWAWSISFYPQVWLNFGRKSVVGLSLDFQVLNMLGFTCYAIYNSALYWNPLVRQEYAIQHGGAVPAVHVNDVFFAIHAAVLTAITLVQCCVHDRGGQVPSRLSLIASALVVIFAVGYGGAVAFVGECVSEKCEPSYWASYLTWLNWLYFLSFVKLGISLVKYIPQVLLNYRRKSTVGWNIWNVLLDFEGGMLSLAQLLMDSGVTKDWSPVTGNPVKFGLGFASMFFDVIFMAQHYVLYREPGTPRATYPTEGGCGDCGQLTCSCIADLARLVSEDLHRHSHSAQQGGASPRGQSQQPTALEEVSLDLEAGGEGGLALPVSTQQGEAARPAAGSPPPRPPARGRPQGAAGGAGAEEGSVDVERAALLPSAQGQGRSG